MAAARNTPRSDGATHRDKLAGGDPARAQHIAALAQLVEHPHCRRDVAGSSPAGGTKSNPSAR
jgi:hypothetical protein